MRVALRLPVHRVWLTPVLLVLIGLGFGAQLLGETLLGYDLLLALAAKENTLIAEGQLWRLFTVVFVHGSVLHVAFNAYALHAIGREVEAWYGGQRFGLVFWLAALAGSAASVLLNPSPAVGASGAIFGLIGAEAVALYRNRELLGEGGRRALQNVGVIVAVNLLLGLQGGIDNWAHLGGLLGGLILSGLIGPVWALPAVLPAPGQTVTLVDTRPLSGARWLAVLAFAAGLAGVTGLAIALHR